MRSFTLTLLALLVAFLGATQATAARTVLQPLPSALEDLIQADDDDSEDDDEDEGGW